MGGAVYRRRDAVERCFNRLPFKSLADEMLLVGARSTDGAACSGCGGSWSRRVHGSCPWVPGDLAGRRLADLIGTRPRHVFGGRLSAGTTVSSQRARRMAWLGG
jgi:hypothetical protein